MDCSTPGLPVHHQLLAFTQTMSIELVMPSNYLILRRPFHLLPSIFPSIRVFSNESVLRIRWPKYWEFQLQHQSFPWIFRTDFLYNGLAGSPCCPRDSQVFSNTIVQKHQLILQHSAFCITQLSTLMTTGKTIALTRQTFVDCVHATSQWSAD